MRWMKTLHVWKVFQYTSFVDIVIFSLYISRVFADRQLWLFELKYFVYRRKNLYIIWLKVMIIGYFSSGYHYPVLLISVKRQIWWLHQSRWFLIRKNDESCVTSSYTKTQKHSYTNRSINNLHWPWWKWSTNTVNM